MLRIKRLVQDNRYEIDPYLVADAILRQANMRGLRGARLRSQKACSKPESSSRESRNSTPGSPSTTDPTQVRPAFSGGTG